MTPKTKRRIDFVLTCVITIVAAVFWPYILGILLGLFAFLVVVWMAIRGFK